MPAMIKSVIMSTGDMPEAQFQKIEDHHRQGGAGYHASLCLIYHYGGSLVGGQYTIEAS